MQPRTKAIKQLLEAAESDPRIVGLVDYGSSSEGRADEWSDVDIALFLQDADFEAFERDWKQWISQFGSLLLAYVGGVGHPWVVYDTKPVPLRVDFAFWRESDIDIIRTWPNSPTRVEAMVLYDVTHGKLTANAQLLVGQSLRPSNLAVTFEKVSGDFWYYLLRTFSKLQRGAGWAARLDFNFMVMGNLFALLRLEAGALDHWRGASSTAGLERVITAERLAHLDTCVPSVGTDALAQSLYAAAVLGRAVCQNIHRQHGWPWPERLAERTVSLLAAAA